MFISLVTSYLRIPCFVPTTLIKHSFSIPDNRGSEGRITEGLLYWCPYEDGHVYMCYCISEASGVSTWLSQIQQCILDINTKSIFWHAGLICRIECIKRWYERWNKELLAFSCTARNRSSSLQAYSYFAIRAFWAVLGLGPYLFEKLLLRFIL